MKVSGSPVSAEGERYTIANSLAFVASLPPDKRRTHPRYETRGEYVVISM